MDGSVADRSRWFQGALAEHVTALVRYASRITGDTDSAQDVVQDAFLRLWQAERAEVTGREREWLYLVCRNRALDVLRQQSRRRQIRHTAGEEIAARSSGTVPSESVERRQALAAALRAVDKLPERQAEVLLLRFRKGLSYREIAAATGLSVSNVGYLIHVAMRTVRDEVRGDDHDG